MPRKIYVTTYQNLNFNNADVLGKIQSIRTYNNASRPYHKLVMIDGDRSL